METVESIMQELKKMGSEQTRKTLIKHGAKENIFGVKVADLKTIVKRIKKNHELAIGLFATGNSDAMYLAGLIGDENRMTKVDLNRWAHDANWQMISEYAVPFVAGESKYGWELAIQWIENKQENVASCGWATLAALVSYLPDEQLDLKSIKTLIKELPKRINHAPNRVKYTMNGFIIAVGCYIKSLTEEAKAIAKKIGTVKVDVGNTACKVPNSLEYIEKVEAKNYIGKKRKTTRC